MALEYRSEAFSKDGVGRLAQAIAYLETRFDSDIGHKELCDLAHMSSRNLLRQFRIITGRSPIRYLNDLRMHEAMLRLRGTPRSITEVAFAVGYNDLSYFNRRFHSLTGLAPGEWRKKPPWEW